MLRPARVHLLQRRVAEARVSVLGVVPREEGLAMSAGKSGRSFIALNCDSEYGLSSDRWARLWLLVMPRSTSYAARSVVLAHRAFDPSRRNRSRLLLPTQFHIHHRWSSTLTFVDNPHLNIGLRRGAANEPEGAPAGKAQSATHPCDVAR